MSPESKKVLADWLESQNEGADRAKPRPAKQAPTSTGRAPSSRRSKKKHKTPRRAERKAFTG
jgi:hypothetical protein